MSAERPPPPAPSPQPPDDVPGTPSGVYRWVNGRLVDAAKVAQLEAEDAAAKALKVGERRSIATLAGTVVVAVGTAFAAYGQVMSEAKKVADAGVAEVAHQVKYLKEDQARLEKKLDRLDASVGLILDKLRVPESARPAQVPQQDGGK